MKPDKSKKAMDLFLSIGEIDDALLHEALEYRPQKKRAPFSPLFPVAASILLCAILLTSVLTVILGGRLSPPPSNNGPSNGSHNSLDTTLLALRAENAETLSMLENETDVPFFDGCAYLVWQYVADGTLCISQALDNGELTELSLYWGQGERVEADSAPQACRVWLVMGNGEVYSPYLPQTPGNMGLNSLFSYDAEIAPSVALASAVSEILNGQAR